MNKIIRQIKKKLIENRKRTALLCGLTITIIIIAGGFALIYTKTYYLDSSINQTISVIPEDASVFFEIKDLTELDKKISESNFIKSIKKSKPWQNLAATPEIRELANLLYFLELKAGLVFDVKDIPSYFDGPVGLAKMPDGSNLIAAKTNLKSRLGVALYSAFKADRIKIKKKTEPEKKNSDKKIVSPDSYKSIFPEEEIEISNLSVSRIQTQKGFIYLVMLNDFLFISDSLDTLKTSLSLASKSGSSSLKNMKGIKAARKDLTDNGQILFYINSGKSKFAPLLKGIARGKGFAFVINLDKNISANIYDIGTGSSDKKNNTAAEWEKKIPKDNTVTLYSETLNINNLIDSINTLDDSWKNFKSGVKYFFSEAEINPEEYFGNQNGLALILDGTENINSNFYPQFSIAYCSKSKDDKILKAIFKAKSQTNGNHNGVSYITSEKTPGHYYTPSYMTDNKIKYISSNWLNIKKIISALKGNRPVIKDLKSYNNLGKLQKSSHHLIIDIPSFINNIKKFYYYGAEKSTRYSSATINKDVMPLFEPLKKFKTLHIAYGMKGNVNGKLIITDK